MVYDMMRRRFDGRDRFHHCACCAGRSLQPAMGAFSASRVVNSGGRRFGALAGYFGMVRAQETAPDASGAGGYRSGVNDDRALKFCAAGGEFLAAAFLFWRHIRLGQRLTLFALVGVTKRGNPGSIRSFDSNPLYWQQPSELHFRHNIAVSHAPSKDSPCAPQMDRIQPVMLLS